MKAFARPRFGARADRVVERFRKLDGKVALISHGHFGRVFGARWIGLNVEQAERLQLATATVSVLEYDPVRAANWAIALWNADVQHLCDTHVPLSDTRS